jgi:hypothetical protein
MVASQQLGIPPRAFLDLNACLLDKGYFAQPAARILHVMPHLPQKQSEQLQSGNPSITLHSCETFVMEQQKQKQKPWALEHL